MRVVYKYPLDPPDYTAELPHGAVILDAQMQHARLHIWALVDPSETDKRLHQFLILGTGKEVSNFIADKLTHVCTLHVAVGQYVWHVFEVAL